MKFHDGQTSAEIEMSSKQNGVLEEWWREALSGPEREPMYCWFQDCLAIQYQCYPSELWRAPESCCDGSPWLHSLTMKVVKMWYPEGLRRVLEGLD